MGNNGTKEETESDLPSNLRRWTMKEIKDHNESLGKTLIIIDRKVFDVTSFLEEHPGGKEALQEYRGEDATSGFVDVGHSPDAKEQMMDFLVGLLESENKS